MTSGAIQGIEPLRVCLQVSSERLEQPKSDNFTILYHHSHLKLGDEALLSLRR